jgi:dTDP-glucose pyrophosphorylase
MVDWERATISPTATIRETMHSIERGELQIALMVDAKRHLLGVATDGDLRRSILNGADLDESVAPHVNPNPITASTGDGPESISALMARHEIHQIPVVDSKGRLVGVEVIGNLLAPEKRPNPVVLMAGGLGTRLRPLTNDCPKPLIEVGGQPILQTVLEGFRAQGFHRFYISVNYKSEMIEQHFGDGRRWNVSIEYLREKQRLGTAGALSLLPESPTAPVLVANGDLLTNLNFAQLLTYHTEHRAMATMGIRQYSLEVPYGVIQIDGQWISQIHEKPTEKYFVNAGIYVLEPAAVARIPENTFYDMPELFERLIDVEEKVTAFPIQEYWQDIGQPDDLDRAQTDYETIFASL